MGSQASKIESMLPALGKLTLSDQDLIEDVCRYVTAGGLWCEMNDVLNPLRTDCQKEISSRKELRKFLNSLSNAVFNYVVTQCTGRAVFCGLKAYFDMWNMRREGGSYRFVWLVVEAGRVTVLNKSSLYYNNTQECLRAGCLYRPSVDFTSSSEYQFLTYEVKPFHNKYFILPSLPYDPLLQETLNCKKLSVYKQPEKAVVYQGARYVYRAVDDFLVVKMPWYVLSLDERKLHIFYIKKFDYWMYSYSEDPDKAVHECLHY
mgnify:CR=1 FL=1